MTDNFSPVQVKEAVYRQLRTALIDHTIAPGEPLRELALSARLGVSKTPIREALVRLDQDGLVEVVPYRGARAKRYTESDVREHYEVREILECECVRRAAEGRDPTLLSLLHANIADTDAALRGNDMKAAAEFLDRFDDILIAQLDNRSLSEVVHRLSAHLKRMGAIGGGVDRYRESLTQHAEIVAAIAQGEGNRAQEVMRAHIASIRDAQIAALDTDDAGRPAGL